MSLRRTPYPPPSVFCIATPNLDRILLPRSRFNGRAHILLPCSLPHFGSAQPIVRPHLRMGPFFRALGLAAAKRRVLLTTCRSNWRIADMSVPALLTIRSKYICVVVAVEAAPYPPPSDRLYATPGSSRILLPRLGSTGPAHILLPCAGPYFRFGFGPIIRLQLRLEPLFFRDSVIASLGKSAWLGFPLGDCAPSGTGR